MSNLNRELRALFDDFLADVLRAVRESFVAEREARRLAPKAPRPLVKRGPTRGVSPAKAKSAPPPKAKKAVASKPAAKARAPLRPRAIRQDDVRMTVEEGEITDPEVLLRAALGHSRAEVKPPAKVVSQVAPPREVHAAVAVRDGETVLRVSTGGVVLRRAKRT